MFTVLQQIVQSSTLATSLAKFSLCGLSVALAARESNSQVTFTVQYNDPSGLFDPYRPLLDDNILASGERWAQLLDGNGTLDLVVNPTTSSQATGRSLTSSFAFQNGFFNVFHQGSAAEVIKGFDPNGSTPDLEININPDRFASSGNLWLDPSPYTRDVGSVPSNKRDAMTVLTHEIGHGLMYSGWMSSTDGTYPGNFQSTFDFHRRWDGSNQFFDGPKAMEVNNGTIPLTYANGSHIGNFSPRPGSNLLGDIMNGELFDDGRRYDVSPLNVAALQDVGFQTKVGKTQETRIDGVEFTVGWRGEAWESNIGAWLPQTEFNNAAFGETTTFDFLGNVLQITSDSTVLDSTSERWSISITAQDGGELFDPLQADRWTGWRVDQFATGEFDPSPDSGGGDPIDVLNFVNFEIPEAIGDWSVQSLEIYSDESLVSSTHISAKAEANGIYLNREFTGDGLTFLDAPGQGSTDLGVTEIRFTIDVQTFFSQVAGDYNQDGTIDESDYSYWAAAFGSNDFAADGNGNGFVDTADYVIWRNAYDGGSASLAVPEPGGLGFGLFAYSVALNRRARRSPWTAR